MKQQMTVLLIFAFFAGNLYSQGTLNEFVIEKDNSSQEVFYKSKGCTPDDGVFVFFTTIPNLKFSMVDTPNRLKSVSAFDAENNCYVLCVQPTDKNIGGITKYSIDVTAGGYKRAIIDVSEVHAAETQYYTINPKINLQQEIEAIVQRELAKRENKDVPQNEDKKVIKEEKSASERQTLRIEKQTTSELSAGIEMVFVTGSDTLPDFYIGKTEVTQAQWKAIMGKNPSHFKGDNLPVEKVSWNDIQKFLVKLNQQTGKNYRLPSSAEWRYAAQGGANSPQTIYSGSDNINKVAWYSGNAAKKTHPVATKQPNELGIYDMTGNVWEWCSELIITKAIITMNFAHMYGGCWSLNEAYTVQSFPTKIKDNSTGFRLAHSK